MNVHDQVKELLASGEIGVIGLSMPYPDELYINVADADFVKTCNLLHERLDSPVMSFFAEDLRVEHAKFAVYCAFLSVHARSWVFVRRNIAGDSPNFPSLSKDIYSASLFEREMKEMFGIEPEGNPDLRSMRLHDEIWPKGHHPLRKDFILPRKLTGGGERYAFRHVEGEGVFEIPVGPVHAGIIGPGHFRFSVAGEPIINLETRLGWTHRGIEKLLEGKNVDEAIKIIECVSGDTSFGYSAAFCRSIEKITGVDVPLRAQLIRLACLESERLYNHANDIGGMALDVGFTFPAQYASLIKEAILRLNEGFSGSRYLKGINITGGVGRNIDINGAGLIREALVGVKDDLLSLEKMLFSSNSFMDRVDTAGILRTKTARDLGVTGPAGRASGVGLDLRKALRGIYGGFSFNAAKEHSGDATARLKIRFNEARESIGLIRQALEKLGNCNADIAATAPEKAGCALGYVEAWRGALLIWTRLNAEGMIERCKITDPSFHNWGGLSYAVLGNIIPDFPLCNKSFDLSYSGNDL